jgi:hypothetical protein
MATVTKTLYFVIILFCSQLIVSQENLVNRKAVVEGLPVTPIVPDVEIQRNISHPDQNISALDRWDEALAKPKHTGVADIPVSSLPTGNRYKSTLPGTDYEKMAENKKRAEFNEIRNIAIILIVILIIILFIYKNYKKANTNFSINSNTPNQKDANKIISQLERIKQLKKEGFINEEEFNTLKKAIIK